MKVEQSSWNDSDKWQGAKPSLGESAQLVVLFGGRQVLQDKKGLDDVRSAYPKAQLIGCSTSGEICGTRIFDDSLVCTAIRFEHTEIKISEIKLSDVDGSEQAGERLAGGLDPAGLVHVLAISDGLQVNGSELVRGMRNKLPKGVQVSGGLAGDGANFEKTLVFLDNQPVEGAISAVGFYGDRLKVGYGSLGGWDTFGPLRTVTKSEGNVLFELDGKPALELYKKYLGEHASGLPATGLLFPLNIRRAEGEETLVRTILAVDEDNQSLTFAGDVPEASRAQLMKANFERLIDGASGAAKASYEKMGEGQAELAILISCVGRKLVLKQRTEEEVEGVQEVLGESAVLTGFYSYGEICPAAPDADCDLHNQTMTITTFREA